jgi:hypothetical protein
MSELDNHSQQYLRKFTNAAERAMTAYDLLFKENLDLFKQNNESHTRESSNSNMVGKAKIMSFEDIQEAQKKRYKKEAAATGRRGASGRTRRRSLGEVRSHVWRKLQRQMLKFKRWE